MKEGVAYSSIRPQLRSFDMIAFRGTSVLSNAISYVEERVNGVGAGRYSHVGLVVMGDDFPPGTRYHTPAGPNNAVYIFESVLGGTGPMADGVNDVDGKGFLGVQLRRLDDVVIANDSNPKASLGWCRMREAARPRPSPDEWQRVFARYNGIRYDASPLDLCAGAFGCLRPWRQCCFGACCCKRNWQFCSELVANVYKDLGVLPPDVDAQNVVPSDYFTRPATAGVAITFDVDGEIPVLFHPCIPITVHPYVRTSPPSPDTAKKNRPPRS